MNFDIDDYRCANLTCGCKVAAREGYCCEACQAGIDTACHCNHALCVSPVPAVWDPDAVPFFAGRLL